MAQNNPLQADKLIEDPTFIQWVQGEQNAHTQEWEYRYHHNPGDRETMDKAKAVVEGIPFHRRFISDKKVESAWKKIEQALDQKDMVNSSFPGKLSSYWKVAAVILLVVFSGLGVYKFYLHKDVLYHTDFGERQEIILPDGSLVTMNANSKLWFQRKNPRNVFMTGEIYFDIERKPESNEPFIVHTPDLDIHVLGTEFNVNSRMDKTDVFLEKGSIELSMEMQGKMLMEPGDFISYSSTHQKIMEHQSKPKSKVITSWKEGVLLLDSISLESTLLLLEQTYNVVAVIENKELNGKILVGGVPNDNLEMCVQALRTIYNLDIELTTDSLIVR